MARQQRVSKKQELDALAYWLYLSRYDMFGNDQIVPSWFYEQASLIDQDIQPVSRDHDEIAKVWYKGVAVKLNSIWPVLKAREAQDKVRVMAKQSVLRCACVLESPIYEHLPADDENYDDEAASAWQLARDMYSSLTAIGERPEEYLKRAKRDIRS